MLVQFHAITPMGEYISDKVDLSDREIEEIRYISHSLPEKITMMGTDMQVIGKTIKMRLVKKAPPAMPENKPLIYR